jgi:hypothetical protein
MHQKNHNPGEDKEKPGFVLKFFQPNPKRK